MTVSPSPPANSRQPLSLRDLFCLTTLAAMTVALVLYREWTDEERWLLGLTLGGTWLGILVARIGGRRGWLAGVLMGTLGGLVVVGLLGFEWLVMLEEQAKSQGWNDDQILDSHAAHILCALITAALAVLLAVFTACTFQLLAWSIDGGERGLAQSVRRHPLRSAAIASSLCLMAVAGGNIEFLAHPTAWRPCGYVPAEEFSSWDRWESQIRHGALSRNGEWLIVDAYHDSVSNYSTPKLYRLDPLPESLPLDVVPGGQAFYAFDCKADRLAYTDHNDAIRKIRILDLTTLKGTSLQDARERRVRSLDWLPSGALIVYDDDDPSGNPAGFTKIAPHDDEWSRQESEVDTIFDARSGLALLFEAEDVQLVDWRTSREIERFPQQWRVSMMEHLSGSLSHWIKISPSGRFVMSGKKIYDRESQAIRDWKPDDDNPYGGPDLYGSPRATR